MGPQLQVSPQLTPWGHGRTPGLATSAGSHVARGLGGLALGKFGWGQASTPQNGGPPACSVCFPERGRLWGSLRFMPHWGARGRTSGVLCFVCFVCLVSLKLTSQLPKSHLPLIPPKEAGPPNPPAIPQQVRKHRDGPPSHIDSPKPSFGESFWPGGGACRGQAPCLERRETGVPPLSRSGRVLSPELHPKHLCRPRVTWGGPSRTFCVSPGQ